MAKGDGTIINKGRNVWEIQVDFGRNPITGKRERVSKTVRGSKRDAAKMRDRIRREHEQGLKADGSKRTFREFATEWQTMRKQSGDLTARTIKDDEFHVRRICRYIGDMKLCEITPHVIESLYLTLKNDGFNGKPLSGTTMRKYHVKLKQILQKAVDYDCILRNPCSKVKAPKIDTCERRSLSANDARRLLSLLDESEQRAYRELAEKERRQMERGNGFNRSQIHGMYELCDLMAVRIGLATGMKLGEVLGLEWRHIDLDALVIRVAQKLDVYGNIGNPKSDAGKRMVSIDSRTAAHLRQWKEVQAVQLVKLGVVPDDSTFVCCSDKGLKTDESNFGRWWRKWSDANGFKGLHFHDLRHTQATQLLANGVDVKTVQTRLGHASASLTLNTYAHALPENDRAASDMIENLFSGRPDEPRIIELKTAQVA